jgi:uncharacterized membrane protein HdeD (DUF308 family)
MTLSTRRIIRRALGIAAVGAGVVVVYWPPPTEFGNFLFFGSVLVLLSCLFLWLLLFRGKHDDDPARNSNP